MLQPADRPLLFVVVVTTLILVSWIVTGKDTHSQTHISAGELQRLIRLGSPPTIIDVRTRYEYEQGHVPGAIHLPFWKALFSAGGLDTPRDKPLVVYCAHGPRAGIGKFALTSAGFTNVLYLEGHMSGWLKAGLPVRKGPTDKQ
jgi:rhodanese-related sulfurtransferase